MPSSSCASDSESEEADSKVSRNSAPSKSGKVSCSSETGGVGLEAGSGRGVRLCFFGFASGGHG